MGLTDLSVCDHSINGVKDSQDIYIMFHDKIIEKLDKSIDPTGLRYSAFQLTSTSRREKRFEMFYFPAATNNGPLHPETGISPLNIASCI